MKKNPDREIKPQLYKISDTKKQEMFTNIKIKAKEPKRVTQPRLMPTIGILGLIAILFLLLYSPAQNWLMNIPKEGQQPSTNDISKTTKPSVEHEPTIYDLFNKNNVTATFESGNLNIVDNHPVYTGTVKITLSDQLLKKLKSTDYGFSIHLSGEDGAVRDMPMNVTDIIKHGNEGIFAFNLSFNKEASNHEIAGKALLFLDLYIKSQDIYFGDISFKELNIDQLIEEETKIKNKIDQTTDKEFINIAHQLYVQRLEDRKKVEIYGDQAIEDWDITNITLPENYHFSDGFLFEITYNILPKYPDKYVLAGSGGPIDDKGWIHDKFYFVKVKYKKDHYEIESEATSPYLGGY